MPRPLQPGRPPSRADRPAVRSETPAEYRRGSRHVRGLVLPRRSMGWTFGRRTQDVWPSRRHRQSRLLHEGPMNGPMPDPEPPDMTVVRLASAVILALVLVACGA